MNDRTPGRGTGTTRQLSRRRFAGSLAAVAGAVVLGFDPLTRSWVTHAHADGVFDELPRLDGSLHLDDATRAAYAEDFGQIVHERPLAVLKPGSVQDIARMVRFARRHHLRIAGRGRGHSTFGQAQVEAGVVIDMSTLRTIHRIAGDRVAIDAGIRWTALLGATLARGLTPPVLTDYIGQSVGGTLSVGGIGGLSYRHGAQVDHVLELEAVTGAGEVVTCSATQNRDLFVATLAGQGQCAVITRAVLRLVAAPTSVRVFNLVYPDFPTMRRDMDRLMDDERFHHLEGWLFRAPDGRWTPLLEAAAYLTPPTGPDDAALLVGLGHIPASVQAEDLGYEAWANRVAEPAKEAHPWLDLFVPGHAMDGFVAGVLPAMTPLAPEDRFSILLIPFKRSRLGRPLFRVPDTPHTFGFGILRFAPPEPALIARMLAFNRRLFEQNRALGGTHYPIDALELTRHDWQRHYGPQWGALVRAKRRYDPDNVLASGPDIFGRPGHEQDDD
jgi:FAD/FMN-containing dehydrogenase